MTALDTVGVLLHKLHKFCPTLKDAHLSQWCGQWRHGATLP